MSTRLVLLVIVPYVLSKVAIAVSTAFLQSFFGSIGGSTLSAEAAALQFEFLLLGAAMGGMRALSIMVASLAPPPSTSSSASSAARFLLRGWLGKQQEAEDGEEVENLIQEQKAQGEIPSHLKTRLRSLFAVSFLSTTAFAVAATLLLVYAAAFVQLFAPNMEPAVAAAVRSYSRASAWGVLPTLWLYCVEQFLLGIHASGVAFLCGAGYALVSTLLCWSWYSAHGAAGLGLGMAVGAWIVFVVVSVALLIDPVFRELCSLLALVRAFHEDDSSVVFIEYLQLATPLALSNVVGLVVSFVIAAAVDDSDKNDKQQKAFSIAGSFYSSLMIAVLGSSSAVSAVVASSRRRADAAVERTAIVSSTFICIAGLILAALPFFATRSFAEFFGGNLNSYSQSTLDSISTSEIRSFLVPCCLAFCFSTMAMCAAAALHAIRDVTAPLIIHVIVYSLGAVWIIVARGRQFDNVVAAAYGTILGPALYLAALLWRWWWTTQNSE